MVQTPSLVMGELNTSPVATEPHFFLDDWAVIYPFCSAQRVNSQLSVWKQAGKRGTLEARDGEQRGLSRGILRAWFGREKLRSQDLSHLIWVNHQVWGVMASWSFTSSLLHSQQDTGLEDYCWVKSCRETNELHFLFLSESWSPPSLGQLAENRFCCFLVI